MIEPRIIEESAHTRLVGLSLVDSLVKALRIADEFPPPIGPITCEITSQSTPLTRTFTPPLVLWTPRAASGYFLVDGTFVREGTREPRLPLGNGTYEVRVYGDYYREQTFTLVWPPPGGQTRVPVDAQTPPKPANVSLLPSGAYPLPTITTGRFQLGPTILRGSLFTAAGAPRAGLKVEVLGLPSPFLTPTELPPLANADWPFLEATSGTGGDWLLVLPGRRYFDPAPEHPPVVNPPIAPIVRATTIRVHLTSTTFVDITRDVLLGSEFSFRNTALRGQVVGTGGRPIAGAVISTSLGPQTSVSRADGVWFLYFDINQVTSPNPVTVTVTATTPDGATASDPTVVVQRDATVVVPTFRFP